MLEGQQVAKGELHHPPSTKKCDYSYQAVDGALLAFCGPIRTRKTALYHNTRAQSQP